MESAKLSYVLVKLWVMEWASLFSLSSSGVCQQEWASASESF
jgi:hypothetical protein